MTSLRMTVTRRDDEDYELTCTDVDGNPINLTGCALFFAAKINIDDPDSEAVIRKVITEFDYPAQGIAILSLTKEETNIEPGDYFFEVQLKNMHGKINSTRIGRMIVYQDINVGTDIDFS